MNNNITVPISIGELWDKYSILLIKEKKIIDKIKLNKVKLEIQYLDEIMSKYSFLDNHLFLNLKKINETLWDLEDKIRIKENLKLFDTEFIELARSIYKTNDQRAIIKNEINIVNNSIINEVKEYVDY